MIEALYQEEGYALIGAAFEVHSVLGGGMAEEIYQESLEIELQLRAIPFSSKPPLKVKYKSQLLPKTYFPDLVVHEHIMVELKTVAALLPEHEAQLINYLRITEKSVGYLINFEPRAKLEWKRFVV